MGEENEENPESWKKKETKQENEQEKEEYEQREKQQVQKEIDGKRSRRSSSSQTLWITLYVCTPKQSPDPTQRKTFWVMAVVRNNVTHRADREVARYTASRLFCSTISLQVSAKISFPNTRKLNVVYLIIYVAMCYSDTAESTNLSLCSRMLK